MNIDFCIKTIKDALLICGSERVISSTENMNETQRMLAEQSYKVGYCESALHYLLRELKKEQEDNSF